VKTFKDVRESLQEAGKVKLASGEKMLKTVKVGKKKHEAIITQKGNKYGVYIQGEKLDDGFKNEKEAVKAAEEFAQLMGEELE
jgi:hypothetical protein